MWDQQAKHMWIIDSNQNTFFFYQNTSNLKQRNSIKGLTYNNGVWHEDDQIIERILLDYFSNIF